MTRLTRPPTGPQHWASRARSIAGVRPTGARVGPAGFPADGPPTPAVQSQPSYYAPGATGYNVLPYALTSTASAWSAVSGGTVADSSAHAYDGSTSVAVTCTSTTTVVRTPAGHVWLGVTFYSQLQALTAVAGCTVSIGVEYLDVPGTVLASTAGPSASPVRTDGSWGLELGALSSPPSVVASGRLIITITSPGGGTVVYLDAPYLGTCQDPPPITSNTYIAFDPPTSSSPTWIDATTFVDTESGQVQIVHGRQDGLSDVNTGTMNLTVDNSDGRWYVSNASGAWYGGIRKGAWIKQTVSFDGVEYTRFVGFVTALPVAGMGAYTTSAVQAGDWFSKLGQAVTLGTGYFHETMTDPYGLPAPWAFYGLSEQAATTSGTTTAGTTTSANDSSGSTTQAYPLTPHSIATGSGTLDWANASAPGYDGDQALTFNQTALTGYVVRGQLSRSLGANWFMHFWVNTTTSSQTILNLADYSAQAELIVNISTSGNIQLISQGTAVGSPYNPGTGVTFSGGGGLPAYYDPVLNDGAWHHVMLFGCPTPGVAGSTRIVVACDGAQGGLYYDFPLPTTLSYLTVGGVDDTLRLGPGHTGLYTGSIYGLAIHDMTSWPQAGQFPWYSAWNLWNTVSNGHAGETTGSRLARIARYAGVPSAWTNLDTGVSLCGPQGYLGRYPLDVLREAARTEGMPLFCATDGRITFKQRTARLNPVSAWTVQASDLDPSSTAQDDYSYVINQSQMTRVGGSQITVAGPQGVASQLKYGLYYTSQQTASDSDTDLANLGAWLITTTADPQPRLLPVLEGSTLSQTPNPLAVSAGWGSALYQAILNSDVSTAFTIGNLPSQMGGGSPQQIIEGWTETITTGKQTIAWNTTYPVTGGVFQLDTSPYNQLDSGYVLAY